MNERTVVTEQKNLETSGLYRGTLKKRSRLTFYSSTKAQELELKVNLKVEVNG